ncbi:hypothetical protein [Myxosarcina sp. GI1]|uniref:hypothetical protein n=1 Tax=Myxosarcina sp. GI1 TaxID=1541065 RepID=UPI00055C25B6|nr:hypothetical protein [Myxosarcina sp. GI1]
MKKKSKVADTISRTAKSMELIFDDSLKAEEIAAELKTGLQQIKQSNLQDVETMLYSQAQILSALGEQLATKGYFLIIDPRITQRVPNLPVNLINLGLRSLEQSRKTLKVLADIKHPKRTTFVKNQLNQLALGESKNAPLDGRIAPGTETEVFAPEALEIQHGA